MNDVIPDVAATLGTTHLGVCARLSVAELSDYQVSVSVSVTILLTYA